MKHPLARLFTPIAMIVAIAGIVVTAATFETGINQSAGETTMAALSENTAGSER